MFGKLITYRSAATEVTVAEILREHWAEYKAAYPVSPEQARVAGALMACRTPQLGGRLDQCNECGAWVFRFNSCRDRHCNQCQKFERAKWVQRQQVVFLAKKKSKSGYSPRFNNAAVRIGSSSSFGSPTLTPCCRSQAMSPCR